VEHWEKTGRNLEVLEPRDWFTTAHNLGGGSQRWPQRIRPLTNVAKLCIRAKFLSCLRRVAVDDEYMEENLVEGSGRVFSVETCV
jgi:hypothetical protein